MALHRDVHWVGRQWAVTGYGIQACDQKQKSKFDIAASRVWEDGLVESMRAEPWFNSEDFSKALAVARTRFPEPVRNAEAFKEEASRAAEGRLKETESRETSPSETSPKLDSLDPPKMAAQKFQIHVQHWPAKFVSQWRVRIRR